MLVKCPYCQKELPKFPARKTKCLQCGNFIYVRTRPSDRQRILVTEKQAERIKKEWQEYLLNAKFKQSLESSDLGFTEEKYLKIKEGLTERFGFDPAEGDILWGVSNQLLEEAMELGDWHRMKGIYFNQALFLHNQGKDCFKILQETALYELKEYQQVGVKKVEILTARDQSCSACQKLQGKILTIEEAIRDKPIPVKDCSFKLNPEAPTGWCRCMYLTCSRFVA